MTALGLGLQPVEQGDVMGKQEPEVPRLQILVAGRGWSGE
jgi:hypothetical protein